MDNTLYVWEYLKEAITESEEDVIELENSWLYDGVIKLPGSRIRISNMYIGTDEKFVWTDPKITLAIVDGDFLPYIAKMSKEEAQELRDALDEVINYKPKRINDIIERYIG